MDYTVAETFELPSGGKLYSTQVNPLVKLKSMSTEDEMRRLNHSDRPMKVMADIIDGCMVEPCGISSYDMCIADYQFLLHRLRVVTYGPEYKAMSTCPLCNNVNYQTINLDSMKVIKFNDELRKYLSFSLPRSGDRVSLKIQTPRMIDDIAIRAKEMQTQTPGIKQDLEFLVNLMSIIDLVNGEKKTDFMLEDYLRKLPLMDSNYILNMSNQFVKSFGVDTDRDTECSVCGLAYKSPFRITSEFYRPSL